MRYCLDDVNRDTNIDDRPSTKYCAAVGLWLSGSGRNNRTGSIVDLAITSFTLVTLLPPMSFGKRTSQFTVNFTGFLLHERCSG